MLHKFTLRQLLKTAEWSDIRATYRCERDPDVWALSVLLILLDSGRFAADARYREALIANLYHRFWHFEDERNDLKPSDCPAVAETGVLADLPEDLVVFLNQIPNHARQLKASIDSPNHDVINAIEYAQKILAQVKDPRTRYLPEPFAGISPPAMRHFLSLNDVARTGWTRTIPAFFPNSETADLVESVAEHSMKAAFLGLCMPQADVSNSFIMGICHDHAEIIVGDIPPQQAPDRALKHRIEHEAYAQMLADLVDTPNAGVFKQSFEQYLTSQTSVARTMHIADKLDMALQALTYENRYSISLEAFLVSATEDMMQAYEAGIHPHI